MKISRREVLVSGLALLAVSGCKSEPKMPASCADTSGLAPDKLQVRTALAYVDRSADPARACADCVQFVPASAEGACGTCHLVAGPIHPLGSCKAFAKKT
jgi:hypothetical protein